MGRPPRTPAPAALPGSAEPLPQPGRVTTGYLTVTTDQWHALLAYRRCRVIGCGRPAWACDGHPPPEPDQAA
jgi:hypothetical protein